MKIEDYGTWLHISASSTKINQKVTLSAESWIKYTSNIKFVSLAEVYVNGSLEYYRFLIPGDDPPTYQDVLNIIKNRNSYETE